MGAATPDARARFNSDLRTSLELASKSVTTKTQKAKDKIFGHWVTFCKDHGQCPSLRDIPDHEDKLAYMLVFAMRYRREGQTGNPVRRDAVAKALQAVGEGVSNLDRYDPRKQVPGGSKLHPLLEAFLKALDNEDSPSTRSYPANFTIIRNLLDTLDTEHPLKGETERHVIDLIIVAFFWLLRPAEYLESSNPEARSQAFLFKHIHLTIGGTVYDAPSAPLNDESSIARITHSALEFSDQKNAVKGEKVGHRATSDPFWCPSKALGRIARRLQLAGAPPDTPIHHHYNYADKQWYTVPPQFVTNALRYSAENLQHQTGIDPILLSARSLRPGGATALLCANVSKDAIQLLGRWKSDAMLRYLRIQAHAFSDNYAQRMLDAGDYTFAPGVHACPDPLPLQAPPAVLMEAQACA